MTLLAGNPGFLGFREVALFTPDECDRIVAEAEAQDHWSTAGIYQRGGAGVDLTERSVANAPIVGDPDGWPIRPLVDAVAAVNDEHFRYDLAQIPPADRPSVLRYDAGSADHFRSHRDSGPFSPTRKLTFIVQLSPSEAYDGCDLVFSDIGEIGTREQGALIVFPTFEFHHVTPVLRGRRHAIVGWVHGPTFS